MSVSSFHIICSASNSLLLCRFSKKDVTTRKREKVLYGPVWVLSVLAKLLDGIILTSLLQPSMIWMFCMACILCCVFPANPTILNNDQTQQRLLNKLLELVKSSQIYWSYNVSKIRCYYGGVLWCMC